MDALQLAAGAGPASRPGPGGEDQPVVRELVAVGEHDAPAGAIEPRRGHAQAPLRVEGVRREQDAFRVVLAGQQLLRQRRPGVRPVNLLAHHDQLAVEPSGSSGLRRPQPGERRPNDDHSTHLALLASKSVN